MIEWAKYGLPTQHICQISNPELENIRNSKAINILDVRTLSKFKEYHIEGAINIFPPDLRVRYQELDKEKEYYVTCTIGYRSTLAISILLQKGFYHLINIAGGMEGIEKFRKNRETIKKY